ncbi:MAG: TadE/TadG family type IV pilus assembly protein [Phycisphaerae bacterium]
MAPAALSLAGVVLVVSLVAALVAWWGVADVGGVWLWRALTSRIGLVAAAVALGCAVLLGWVVSAMWQIGRRARSRRRADDGSVLVEFVLLLPIALSVSLGMLQSSLLMAGNVCVHYAAYAAARSAVVQVPRYAGPSEMENEYTPDEMGGKFGRIHAAAVWPLVPISYGGTDQDTADDPELVGSLIRFHDSWSPERPFWLDDRILRKLDYARNHTFVELDPPGNGMIYQAGEDIRARLRHTYYLSVPYAGWFFSRILDDGVDLDADGAYGLIIEAHCTLSNEGVQDWIEIEEFDVRPN